MTTESTSTSKQNLEALTRGMWRENPTFVMLLGLCPVLAVTNSVINALAIGLATTFVLIISNTLVSVIRLWIPNQVRLASYILVIATSVTVVDNLLQAISFEVHKALGAFIPLIVVNCIILGRAEAYASRNSLTKSVLDALGFGTGFTGACICMGTIREIIGAGTFAGLHLFGPDFAGWSIMVLPGGAFFVLGFLLLMFNWWHQRQERQKRLAAEAGVDSRMSTAERAP